MAKQTPPAQKLTPAQRLDAAEAELATRVAEHESLKNGLGDPAIKIWIAERGLVPRSLSAFERATVKRIEALDQQIEELENECDALLSDVVCGLAQRAGEADDPEILLRASLVAIYRLHKAGTALPESRAMTKALVRYLRSLAEDEELNG